MQRLLLRAWESQQSPLAWALRPAAAMYGLLLQQHRKRFAQHPELCERLPVLVVVVGNVVAGGAGKTPTTIALAQHLCAQGWQVGIVSRGYGRQTRQTPTDSTVPATQTLEVHPDSDANTVGDEPLLMHRHTGVPVFVSASRVAAGRALLQAHPHTQVLLCDDGLQHWALQRDIEVCVLDDRGIGNGWLLPAGPLREPWPRQWLTAAGQAPERCLYLHTAPNAVGNSMKSLPYSALATRQLANYAVTQQGEHIALSSLQATVAERPLLALAGIARPERFFAMLQAQGVPLTNTLALPDHYHFDSSFSNQYGHYRLICTEKDAVKLWPQCPDALAVPLLQTLPTDWLKTFDTMLAAAQARAPWL
ncbi:tetraacyldisaccharide 4'-kinase [Curvibacter sp. CHRR-16]|uniref:tetraacyldisaccharide 4'-kinase n=1 Tax=Curvibacter sp. CHRR-16 TaxID=2835872 RepID=UPI001BD9EC96|nr:tetraacyldisaccharide 4'-kinase [Curvibacter sp. CHRR-16]MBT0569244.1 tetraacyldisaccharide 4'-kinase [Curvibacter sp. CHRR-16]